MSEITSRVMIRKEDLKYLKVGNIYIHSYYSFRLLKIGMFRLKGEILELITSIPTKYNIGDIIRIPKENINIARHYSSEEQEKWYKKIYTSREEIENSKKGWGVTIGMGKDNIFDWMRSVIGSISWRLFLWANRTTPGKYWESIYQQEKTLKIKFGLEKAIEKNNKIKELTKE